MKVSQATKSFLDYHRVNSKKNTLRNYLFLLTGFSNQFGDREAQSLTSEEILSFLGHLTEGAKQSTKRLRFSLLRAFFTFIINTGNERFQNPCDSPMLRKVFKDYRPVPWKIVEKETVDELIFRTPDQRNRLILELMARGGMRIGACNRLKSSLIKPPIPERVLLLSRMSFQSNLGFHPLRAGKPPAFPPLSRLRMKDPGILCASVSGRPEKGTRLFGMVANSYHIIQILIHEFVHTL